MLDLDAAMSAVAPVSVEEQILGDGFRLLTWIEDGVYYAQAIEHPWTAENPGKRGSGDSYNDALFDLCVALDWYDASDVE